MQAVKDKAKQANDTANDVLARIKDLNQNLLGLKNNYSKLADDVAKTNAVVKDPIKNSKFFIWFVYFPLYSLKGNTQTSHCYHDVIYRTSIQNLIEHISTVQLAEVLYCCTEF